MQMLSDPVMMDTLGSAILGNEPRCHIIYSDDPISKAIKSARIPLKLSQHGQSDDLTGAHTQNEPMMLIKGEETLKGIDVLKKLLNLAGEDSTQENIDKILKGN